MECLKLNLILHSYGEEHKDILAALFVFLGLNIDTCKCAGERHYYSLAAAGSYAVDKESVIECNEHILTLVSDLNLIICASDGGIRRDRHKVTVDVETNVASCITRNSLLCNESRSFKCGNEQGSQQEERFARSFMRII